MKSLLPLILFLANVVPIYSQENLIQNLVTEINTVRTNYGLAPLVLDEQVTKIAQQKVQAVAQAGLLDHGAGGSHTSLLQTNGITYVNAFENLASGMSQPSQAVNIWVRSTGHRTAMLSQTDKVGVGFTLRNGVPYWAAIFLTRPPQVTIKELQVTTVPNCTGPNCPQTTTTFTRTRWFSFRR